MISAKFLWGKCTPEWKATNRCKQKIPILKFLNHPLYEISEYAFNSLKTMC